MEKVPVVSFNKFFAILTCTILLCSCTMSREDTIVDEIFFYGTWILIGHDKQINYPYIEFFDDSSAVFHSQSDTIYRFSFYIKKDSIHIVDFDGTEYVNKFVVQSKGCVKFKGIAGIKPTQIYMKDK